MTDDYEFEKRKAEAIIDDAKFIKDIGDLNNISAYYSMYDEIGELKLNREDIELYRTRLDSILGNHLK